VKPFQQPMQLIQIPLTRTGQPRHKGPM
jgi:hypothetical protein